MAFLFFIVLARIFVSRWHKTGVRLRLLLPCLFVLFLRIFTSHPLLSEYSHISFSVFRKSQLLEHEPVVFSVKSHSPPAAFLCIFVVKFLSENSYRYLILSNLFQFSWTLFVLYLLQIYTYTYIHTYIWHGTTAIQSIWHL